MQLRSPGWGLYEVGKSVEKNRTQGDCWLAIGREPQGCWRTGSPGGAGGQGRPEGTDTRTLQASYLREEAG